MTDTETPALLATSDARIEALEIHAAHQSQVIEDLNETVAEQWAAIDALRRQLTATIDRLEAAETRAGLPPAQQPPHY